MRGLIMIGAAMGLLGGCTMAGDSDAPGRQTYLGYCASCHGMAARGDGPLAADLPVAPADLTGLAARNGGVFPASDVMAKIYGYPGRYQSHVMPEFGPILEGPTVVWRDEAGVDIETPIALLELAQYIETLQEK